MSEQESDVTVEDIIAALKDLEAKWESRTAETQAMLQKLRIGDPNHSYYRGIGEGYKVALKDLRALLYEPDETQPTRGAIEIYAAVDRDRLAVILERAGLSISELHAHKDNTFSAIFPPLQVLSMDERIAKLNVVGDVVILDTGRFPNSSKTYIDFAFRIPPG